MASGDNAIRSRVAVFSGAALGGVHWAVLSLIVVSHQAEGQTAPAITPGELWPAIASSIAIGLIGGALLLVSRTTARTAAVALIICALSGWVVFGAVLTQSWMWRH